MHESKQHEPTGVSVLQFAQRWQVGVNTVRSWMARGMPVARVGRVVRVPVQEADAWVRGGGPQRRRRAARP